MVLVYALLIGLATGLRSMTGPAAVSWAARLGFLRLGGTGLAFLAHPLATAFFTLAALGEFVGDKLPQAPARTQTPGLVTRLLVGGMCGAAVTMGHGGGALPGVGMGVVGALVGTFGGYQYRVRVPKALRFADFPFAVLEDLFAVGLCALVITRG